MTTTTETPTGFSVRRSHIASVSLGLIAVALVAAAFGLVLAGGTYEALPGIADPGPLVTWGAPALRVLTDLAAIATVGLLLSATILAPSGKDGTLSRTGRKDAVGAVWAAGVWALLAAVQLFFLLALVLAVPPVSYTHLTLPTT